MQPALLALPCVAALGLLLFVGGFYVSCNRARFRTLHAGADDPAHALTKAVRAHGNTAEYAAFLALLIWLAGQHSQAEWVGWTMLAATVSRYLFVAGMLLAPTLARPNPLRAAGAFGTYLCGPALSLALVLG